VVDGVRGHHNHGCGIAALQAPASSPATIQNSQFDHNGYHGICDYPVGTQILDDDIGFNNAIGFAHGTGIKVHGSNGLIQGNTIHDNDGPGVSLGQLADGTGADGERIQSNTITTNAGEGVQLTHACNILVDGNTITGNQLFAIDIQDSNTDSISNNIVSVPASSTYGGIRIMATKATAPNYDCGI